MAINPWCSTKDVDQTVLAAVKVVRVLLGIQSADAEQPPRTLKQKLQSSSGRKVSLQRISMADVSKLRIFKKKADAGRKRNNTKARQIFPPAAILLATNFTSRLCVIFG